MVGAASMTEIPSIMLIGCGRSKLQEQSPARDLYTGSLFRARRSLAEEMGCRWFVISAKHGLLYPDRVIAPYDVTIDGLSVLDRAAWFPVVTSQLIDAIEDPGCFYDDRDLRRVTIEIHAGESYASRLVETLRAAGFTAFHPVANLGQGKQMEYYAVRRRQVGYSRIGAGRT